MVLKDDDSYTCTPCSFVEFLFFMGPNDESLKKKKQQIFSCIILTIKADQ